MNYYTHTHTHTRTHTHEKQIRKSLHLKWCYFYFSFEVGINEMISKLKQGTKMMLDRENYQFNAHRCAACFPPF